MLPLLAGMLSALTRDSKGPESEGDIGDGWCWIQRIHGDQGGL